MITGQPAKTGPQDGLPNLDFLRATAVLLVFIDHLLLTTSARGFGPLGYFGVILFFIHTSLVLLTSMERLGLSGWSLYIAFAIRRFFRIYPLSVLAVLAAVAIRIPVTSWAGHYQWLGGPTLAANLLLVQNVFHRESLIGVLWSLPFEIQMYAILPLFFPWASLRRFRPTLAVVWLIAVAVAVTEWAWLPGTVNPDFLLTRYFPCFLAGVLAWNRVKNRRPTVQGYFWVLFLISVILGRRVVDLFLAYGSSAVAVLRGAAGDPVRSQGPIGRMVADWLFCVVIGLSIPMFLQISNRWLQVVSRVIARYSYGIYITHVPVLWLCLVKCHLGPTVVGAAASVILTALFSCAAYHGLEDPAIRLGKRWAARVQRSRTVFERARFSTVRDDYGASRPAGAAE